MENESQGIDILALAAALFDATQKITILDGRLIELTQKHIREVQELTDRLDVLEARLMGMSDPHEAGLN
jgi:hypothetical protein